MVVTEKETLQTFTLIMMLGAEEGTITYSDMERVSEYSFWEGNLTPLLDQAVEIGLVEKNKEGYVLAKPGKNLLGLSS